ncbi:hypothetical protein [Herpetosiphon geysericola]|uniref:Uncharacterized protein n=1 Tax=Herpetosiphon geysericola TaxID=70996 RepID=A0A0P6YN06_9CHLR|nr:hypothetical protein [Herpetosiphon geysericola]KPL91627.1 hypothetical protein SE18_01100 [Herpetosiphon geysericola]
MSKHTHETIKALIIRLHNENWQPSAILYILKSLGLGREMADYFYFALDLDPDVVTYIYAWYRQGISDERLDFLIQRLNNW